MDDAGLQSAQCMLVIQYRMLPEISRWPNQHFYKGQLRNWCDTFSRRQLVDLSRPIPGFPWPQGLPLAFVHVERPESCPRGSNSKFNQEEAYHVAKICRSLLRGGWLSEQDLGVITPYRAQINAIRRQLGPQSTIYCETVDKFQGQERKCILFSCVRSNSTNACGFLSDGRR